MSQGFRPPLFKDLGKDCSDLLTKKFEYTRKLLAKTSSRDLTLETTGFSDKPGDYHGGVKATSETSLGTFELELDTKGKTSGSFETAKLANGLAVKLSGNETPSGTLRLDYRQDMFSASAVVDVLSHNTELEASTVVGFEGLSVGGQARYDSGSQQVSDYNVGFQYQRMGLIATLVSKRQADVLHARFNQKIGTDTTVAGEFTYNVPSGSRLLVFGAEHKLRDVLVKGTIDSQGIVSAFMEQRLYNPLIKVGLSAQWSSKAKGTLPDKAGFFASYGDK